MQRSFSDVEGEEKYVFGDTGYQGVEKCEENEDTPDALYVAMHPSKRKALPVDELGRMDELIEIISRC